MFSSIIKDQSLIREYKYTDPPSLELHRVEIEEDSDQGRALHLAREALDKFLRNCPERISKLLKFYVLLDSNEGDLKTVGPDYLSQNVDQKQALIAEVEALFPTEALAFSLSDAWAHTLFNDETLIDESLLFGDIKNSRIIRLMFTLMHEIAHKKKMLFLAQNNYVYQARL